MMTGDLSDEYGEVGVVALRGVLDRRAAGRPRRPLDENLAAPGPWADDYTPAGGTGRFFGDYVNWSRIDGYRRAALHGPLPRLATDAARRPRGSSTSTRWSRSGHRRGDAVAPRRAVLLRGRRQNVSLWVPLDPVPAAAGVGSCAVRTCGAGASCPARFVEPRRTPSPTTASSWSPTSTPLVDRHEIVVLRPRARRRPGLPLPDAARRARHGRALDGRRRAVSFRYVGGDARFAVRPWLHSPPFDPIGPGEPLDDERFPG